MDCPPDSTEKWGTHSWLNKLLEDVFSGRTIDFEGRPVPKWAQNILIDELLAHKARKHCNDAM